MTLIFYDSVEQVQSHTGDANWLQVASKTGHLNAREHMLWVYAEYGGTVTNRTVHVRVLLDGVEKSSDYHLPETANEYKAFSTFGLFSPAVEGDHTISLEIRGGHASQTVGVRRVRLAVMQE